MFFLSTRRGQQKSDLMLGGFIVKERLCFYFMTRAPVGGNKRPSFNDRGKKATITHLMILLTLILQSH